MTGSTSSGPVGPENGHLNPTPPSTSLDGTSGNELHPNARNDIASTAITLARGSWHILAVLAAFVVSMFIVPVMTNVPVGDDWVYTRSVEILLDEGRLEILDLSVVTLVFQIGWGALFSLLFGDNFGTHRLSTTVLFLASGLAMYGLCLELGVRKARAALGAAMYLFNPLAYVLAFTFMTDPQFTALMVISSYYYVRGLSQERLSNRDVVIGSVFAAFAFLVRQQGLLIPLAIGLYLVLARRWKFDRDGIVTAVRVAGIPAVAMVLYYAWILFVHGAPEQQGMFIETIRETGFESTRLLTYRMTYIELVYAGFFALPVMLAVAWYVFTGIRDTTERRIQLLHWVVLTLLFVAGGMIAFGSSEKLMPFISQYLGLHGLGPQDLIGRRDQLISTGARRLITWVIFAGAALLVMLLVRRFRNAAPTDRATASLVGSIALWQVVGIMPPSFHFASWIISVDRYLLPLLPFSIALALWAVRDYSLSMPVAWVVVGAFALFSVAGTRDFIVFQDATWDMGREGLAMGIAWDKLDAGASWDGYFLYEPGLEAGINEKRSPAGSPFWTDLFAKATDSSYIVSSSIPEGWGEDTIVARREYSSWLHDDPQYLYLLRRPGVAGPP